jgi:hypothetical protein
VLDHRVLELAEGNPLKYLLLRFANYEHGAVIGCGWTDMIAQSTIAEEDAKGNGTG